MIRRPPRSTPFPTRRSSDLDTAHFAMIDVTSASGEPFELRIRPAGGLSVARFPTRDPRSEEHTSELQSPCNLVCRLLLEKKKKVQTLIWSTVWIRVLPAFYT